MPPNIHSVCRAGGLGLRSDLGAERRFHRLRLPQISCSEGKMVQVASVFLGGVGGSGGAGGW